MSKSFLRNVIGEYMTVLGRKNEKVVIVNADLSGTCRNKAFVETFPERSFNMGIAEQNMLSFAAGLACEGFIPYTFSMAPFLTMRACEQIRDDVAYGNRNVRMIGAYAGVSGGISGATHWALEDCGIMTSIPGIKVLEVSDASQARSIMDLTLEPCGPVYIRTTVEPTEDLYDEAFQAVFGGSVTVTDGMDGAILCSGVVVQYALEAARRLCETKGLSVRVVDLYSIKPIDRQAVISAAETGRIVVAQDHNIYGGLGSMVSTILSEEGISVKFRILGIRDDYSPMAHAPFLYKKYQLDADGLQEVMESLF